MVKQAAKSFETAIERKKSRFIAFLSPIETRAQWRALLKNLRKEHPKARHVASAFILSGSISGSSDDGEPHGTAGKPLLQALQYTHAVKTGLAVVRYFGGVLLGCGPLARAYASAAQAAVQNANWVVLEARFAGRCLIDYAFYGQAELLLRNFNAAFSVQFEQQVFIDFTAPIAAKEQLEQALTLIGASFLNKD